MFKKLMVWFKEERQIIFASIVAGFVLTLFISFCTYAYSENVQTSIAEEIIRLHVKANSDNDYDIALKEKVKDEILKRLEDGLADSKSKVQTKEFLQSNLTFIEEVANEVVTESGYSYPVKAYLTNDFFPTKAYGDVKLPAGEYEALRVDIGEAEGSNWWCVMFPPLCYVDVTKKTLSDSEKSTLKYILTSDEYELVTNGKEPTVEVKFKIVEWWQKQKQNDFEKQQKSMLVKK